MSEIEYTCPKCGWTGKEGEQQLYAMVYINHDICPACYGKDVDDVILLEVEYDLEI